MFPSCPSSAPFTHLSTRCYFPLWWVQVKKKPLPSSPTPLLLAQNRMIKARVSHLSNCNNATVPSKAKMPHCEMTGYWYESVVSFPGEIRGGPVDVYCYVALSDLTSVVEERCHGGQTYWDMCLCQFCLAGIWYNAFSKSFQLFFLSELEFVDNQISSFTCT